MYCQVLACVCLWPAVELQNNKKYIKKREKEKNTEGKNTIKNVIKWWKLISVLIMRLNEKYPLCFIIMIFYAKKEDFYLMIDNYEMVKIMRYIIKKIVA